MHYTTYSTTTFQHIQSIHHTEHYTLNIIMILKFQLFVTFGPPVFAVEGTR